MADNTVHVQQSNKVMLPCYFYEVTVMKYYALLLVTFLLPFSELSSALAGMFTAIVPDIVIFSPVEYWC